VSRFFVLCYVILVFNLSWILAWSWKSFLSLIFNKSFLGWAKNSSFSCYFSLELYCKRSSLILARSWSVINLLLFWESLFIRCKSTWLGAKTPINLFIHYVVYLITTRTDIELRILFGSFFVVKIESFYFGSKKLKPFWVFACLEACLFIGVIICSGTRSLY